MRSSQRVAPFLSLIAALIAGCSQDAESGAGAPAANLGASQVASVNGRPIAESVVRIYTSATERRNFDELSPEERERIVSDVIGLELLAQQAEKEGLTESRALAAQIELQRLQLVGRAMATEYLEKNPATEADIQAIYDENLSRLSGQQFKARHILVTSKEEADDVIAELRRGADFVALAEQRADGPTGPNGGALDWFTLDSMPPAFSSAVQAMAVGSHSSEPVQTEFGFHVILLEDTRAQEPPALAEIRDELATAAGRKRLDDYIRSLRESATVTVEP
jgi:peptidyl-prolyl cis-trans isomerase C